jgi:AcrR family transcriptional regulator
MLRANCLAKINDASVKLLHITALRLPKSGVSFSTLTATMQTPVGRGTVDTVVQDAQISKPPRIDGRRLRSERTKQLIIEAFLSLLRDTPQMPTAVQIAERAGYSVRSIFERFPDLNALRVAATDYQLAQALALAPPRGADGNRETRLRSQVNTRAHTCERGVSLWRVLLQFADQDQTGQLKQRVARSRETTVGRIELMYRTELSTMAEDERRQLLIALEALTDMESWARMREQHGLSFDEACEVWIHAIDRLLPPTPIASAA